MRKIRHKRHHLYILISALGGGGGGGICSPFLHSSEYDMRNKTATRIPERIKYKKYQM